MEQSSASKGPRRSAEGNSSARDSRASAEVKKIEAEAAKLEAETRTLVDELDRPWHRKRYFFQAVTAGLVAFPLLWLYFEKVALPVSRSASIEQELKNWEVRKELALLETKLESDQAKIDQERRASAADRQRLIAQVQSYQKALAASEKRLEEEAADSQRTQREKRRLEGIIGSLKARALELEGEIRNTVVEKSPLKKSAPLERPSAELTIEGTPGEEVQIWYRGSSDTEQGDPAPIVFTGRLGSDGRVTVVVPQAYLVVGKPNRRGGMPLDMVRQRPRIFRLPSVPSNQG
jgi:hypothetical protein